MSETVERLLSAVDALSKEEREKLFHKLAARWSSCAVDQREMSIAFETDDLEGQPDYIIIFDGGSRGNPGPGYGSYALVRHHDRRQTIVRLDFDRDMTNNEAEYEALIAALEDLKGRIERAERRPQDFSVEIRGDSKLVLNQVDGTWKAKDDRMRALRNRARQALAPFGAHRLVHQDREESVRVLGH